MHMGPTVVNNQSRRLRAGTSGLVQFVTAPHHGTDCCKWDPFKLTGCWQRCACGRGRGSPCRPLQGGQDTEGSAEESVQSPERRGSKGAIGALRKQYAHGAGSRCRAVHIQPAGGSYRWHYSSSTCGPGRSCEPQRQAGPGLVCDAQPPTQKARSLAPASTTSAARWARAGLGERAGAEATPLRQLMAARMLRVVWGMKGLKGLVLVDRFVSVHVVRGLQRV
jgi:hypothetical protein